VLRFWSGPLIHRAEEARQPQALRPCP
jgi:hypothetical protein